MNINMKTFYIECVEFHHYLLPLLGIPSTCETLPSLSCRVPNGGHSNFMQNLPKNVNNEQFWYLVSYLV